MVTTAALRFMKYSDTIVKRWLRVEITLGILGRKEINFL